MQGTQDVDILYVDLYICVNFIVIFKGKLTQLAVMLNLTHVHKATSHPLNYKT